MTQSENNLTKFTPADSQKLLLKAFQDKKYLCTVEEGCKKAGFESRQTFYDQFDNCPGFEEWWAAEADLFFQRKLPKVKASVLDAAISKFDKDDGKYNSKAQELFLQRFDKGFVPRSKKEVEHSGQVGVNLSKLTDEQLKAMEQELQIRTDFPIKSSF